MMGNQLEDSPLDLEPVAQKRWDESASRLKAIAPLRVLIVDDDRSDRRIISRLLRNSSQSFQVQEATDFDEALALVRSSEFDCILLDFSLPGGTGFDFADAVQQVRACTAPAIIVVSGSSSQRLGVDSLRHGATNMVCKSDICNLDLTQIILDAVSERQRSRLALSGRMRAFAQLVSNTAHKVNNPAAILRLSISAAMDELRNISDSDGEKSPSSDRIQRLLSTADDAVDRIANVIRELENTTGTSLGHVHRFSAGDIVRTALRSYESTSYRISKEGSSARFVVGDLSQLARMLGDLVENAMQAAGPGGRVSVGIEDEGTHVALTVDDDGPGVRVEDVERLFEPLYTTRASEGALGMGLPRVATIVRRHGGTIGVEDAPLGGCRVRVRLPSSEASSSSHPPPSHGPTTKRVTRPRLLVLEDEPLLRQQYFRVLGSLFDVHTAESGQKARELLERFRFDVILCDVTLPEESGVEFVQKLQESRPSQADRVIFITGGVVDESAAHFVQKWENGCLLKPILPKDLKASLSAFVENQGRS